MYIARKLRQSHVTAYVLYMYQVEDIIRAYGFDLDRICSQYLPRFNYTKEQQAEVGEWYVNLIGMMRDENIQEKGHLQVVRNTVLLLADRHQELLQDPKQSFYNAAYFKALPCIVDLRAHGASREVHEIENCLDAVYGVTLLKMKGQEVSEATENAIKPIVHLLEMLSKEYNNEKTS